jgi:ribosomal protein S19
MQHSKPTGHAYTEVSIFRADLEEGNKVGTKLGEYVATRLVFDKRNEKLATNKNQQQ